MADFAAAGSVSSAEPGYKFVKFTSLLTDRPVSLKDPVVLAMNDMDRLDIELPFLEGFSLPRIQYGMPSTKDMEDRIDGGLDNLFDIFPEAGEFGDLMAGAVRQVLKALPDELVSPNDAGNSISSLVEGVIDKISLPDLGALFTTQVNAILAGLDDLMTEEDFENWTGGRIEDAKDALESFFGQYPLWSYLPSNDEIKVAFEARGLQLTRLIQDRMTDTSIYPQNPSQDSWLQGRWVMFAAAKWGHPDDIEIERHVTGTPKINAANIARKVYEVLYDKIFDLTAANAMGGRIFHAFDDDGQITRQITKVLRDSAGKLRNAIINIIEDIEALIPALLENASDVVKGLAGKIGKELEKQMANLEDLIAGISRYIGDELVKHLETLMQTFPTVGYQIGTAIAGYLNQIMRDPAVQTQSVSIGDAIGERLGQIFHNELLPLMRGSGTFIGGSIADLMEELWGTHIEPQIDEINDIFDSLQVRIDNLTGDIAGWIKDALFKPVLAPVKNVSEDGFEIYTKGGGKSTRYIAFSGSGGFDLPGEGILEGLRERFASRSTMDG